MSLIQIEGMNTMEEVAWYYGKHMVYIYKTKVKKNGNKAARQQWSRLSQVQVQFAP